MKIPHLLCVFVLVCVAATAGAQEFGTIRATTKLRPDGSKTTTIVDPEKRTAEETLLDSGGKVLRKTTYILGEGDRSVGAIFADAKGAVIYKASYQRDAAGRVSVSTFTSPDDKYLGKRVFFYGAGETVSRMEDYDANNQLIVRPEAVKPGASGKKRR